MGQNLSPNDIYIAYLPLAHLYELFELFCLSLGMSIVYATTLTHTDKSTGIKKDCRGDASLLRPTVLAAVPLILNRIRKSIEEEVAQNRYLANKYLISRSNKKSFEIIRDSKLY
jgi:long-chain acyl-CoA synthetase